MIPWGRIASVGVIVGVATALGAAGYRAEAAALCFGFVIAHVGLIADQAR